MVNFDDYNIRKQLSAFIDRLVYVRLQGIVLVVKAIKSYVISHAIQKL